VSVLARFKKRQPQEDPASLGNILLRLRLITPEQLGAALQRQAQRAPLGEILVEMGALSRERLDWALMQQSLARDEKGAAHRLLTAQTAGWNKLTSDIRNLALHARPKATK
jgi:hypothetical protein